MDFQEKLKKALQLDIHYDTFQPFSGAQPTAAVLILFSDLSKTPHLLVTRRSTRLKSHHGQYAFPGGKIDAEDHHHASPASQVAAKRETHEEVGVPPETIQILGSLPLIPTLSTRTWVEPWIGHLGQSHHTMPLEVNQDEVDWAGWLSWQSFLLLDNYRKERFHWKKKTFPNHIYQVQDHTIWGATAAMIHLLKKRIEQASLTE